jgi:hypothetical protein
MVTHRNSNLEHKKEKLRIQFGAKGSQEKIIVKH